MKKRIPITNNETHHATPAAATAGSGSSLWSMTELQHLMIGAIGLIHMSGPSPRSTAWSAV
jgi:hypothetical protein